MNKEFLDELKIALAPVYNGYEYVQNDFARLFLQGLKYFAYTNEEKDYIMYNLRNEKFDTISSLKIDEYYFENRNKDKKKNITETGYLEVKDCNKDGFLLVSHVEQSQSNPGNVNSTQTFHEFLINKTILQELFKLISDIKELGITDIEPAIVEYLSDKESEEIDNNSKIIEGIYPNRSIKGKKIGADMYLYSDKKTYTLDDKKYNAKYSISTEINKLYFNKMDMISLRVLIDKHKDDIINVIKNSKVQDLTGILKEATKSAAEVNKDAVRTNNDDIIK